MSDKNNSGLTQFDYLLNSLEFASQAEEPARANYGGHRKALFAYVRDLEARSVRLSDAEAALAAKPRPFAEVAQINQGRYFTCLAAVGVDAPAIGTKLYAAAPKPDAEALNAELVEALTKVRRVLKSENENPFGAINDTIWVSYYQTLFDYIDATLENADAARAALLKAEGAKP